MLNITSALSRVLAVTALCGGLAFSLPVSAATDTTTGPAITNSGTGHHHHMHKEMEQNIETRISTLHDKLKITPEQETQWTDVAQAMRDNESAIKALIEARHQSATTMTAVEDLESYQKIAQSHVDGLGKVIAAFEPLYDAMSDEQKKNADDVFGHFEGHRGDMGGMKKHDK